MAYNTGKEKKDLKKAYGLDNFNKVQTMQILFSNFIQYFIIYTSFRMFIGGDEYQSVYLLLLVRYIVDLYRRPFTSLNLIKRYFGYDDNRVT